MRVIVLMCVTRVLKLVRVYNLIALQPVDARGKLIPARTGRAATNPRPLTESTPE